MTPCDMCGGAICPGCMNTDHVVTNMGSCVCMKCTHLTQDAAVETPAHMAPSFAEEIDTMYDGQGDLHGGDVEYTGWVRRPERKRTKREPFKAYEGQSSKYSSR